MSKYLTWKIDERNEVQLKFGFPSKTTILVNGENTAFEKTGKGKRTLSFNLVDGRPAEIIVAPYGIFRIERELRVQGEPVLSEGQRPKVGCAKCGAKFKPGDKFCEKCGAEIPSLENQLRMFRLREAAGAIGYLAAMFLVFGVFIYFVKLNEAEETLQKISAYADSAQVAQPINGKTYTFGELRKEINDEPLDILLTNGILAAIMFGLFLYSRKSPFVAIITAAAVYGSVIVLNAIIDPKTIAQGLLVKIIVIAIFVRGIKMALELRKQGA